MKRISDPDVLKWLDGRLVADDSITGYDATGWDANVWILHAMYETKHLPVGISHDDVRRIERAAGVAENADGILAEVLADATLIGSCPSGQYGWPGPGWERLRWSELARRLDVDPFAGNVPPRSGSFPYSSWPANIQPPGEGSLDREQFLRLLEHLAAVSPEGHRTTCFAFYAPLVVRQLDEGVVYTGHLAKLLDRYDDEDLPGSPSNIWPEDRSWFLYSDWDLWGTKVSGSADLIDRVVSDPELDVVSLNL